MTDAVHRFQPAGPGVPLNAPYDSGDSFNPIQILRRMWMRRYLLFAIAGTVFVLLASILYTLTPRYTGTAQILIEAPASPRDNPLQISPVTVADREKVVSEVQVLLSRAIADRTISDFKLDTKPEFNPVLDTGRIARLKMLLGLRASRAEVVERFYKQLNVYQVGTTRVIAVEFSSSDPSLARDVANRVADLYIEQQRRAGLDTNVQARDWLSQQIAELRNRVAASEAEAEAFRARTGLHESGAGTQFQSQQLSELNTQLGQARAARDAAQARVANMEQLIGTEGSGRTVGDSEIEVLQSPLIQQLRGQQVQLNREISELSAQLLPSHPRMVQKEAELENLNQQIRTEIGKVISSVRNEATLAAVREASVQRELSQLEARRVVADRDQIELRALEREAAANRSVLESFLSRYTEVLTRGDLSIQEANARIISRADLPESPSFPQKQPMLVLAALVGLAAGLTTVFIAELANQTVGRSSDIESWSGAPVLAVLPAMTTRSQDGTIGPLEGNASEGIRALKEGLGIVPSGNQSGRILLITSTARGEGRTTTAIALARCLSEDGLRVLLVDADFQHPDLAATLGLRLALGFSDLLMGRAAYKNAIVRDPASRAHVLGAGRSNPMAALASPRLHAILSELNRAYDVIILDAAPIWSAEVHLLSPWAEQCIYAVRWGTTEKNRATAGVRHLANSGLRGGIGLVLTCADQTTASRSGNPRSRDWEQERIDA